MAGRFDEALDEYRKAQKEDPGSGAIRAETARLELVVEGRHSVTFWREADLIAARNRLKERMAPARG